ncbi:MAG: hypothetical protein NZX11_00475, partial [Thermus sp.]|nr:hypothetical protein [Thermus sp.]
MKQVVHGTLSTKGGGLLLASLGPLLCLLWACSLAEGVSGGGGSFILSLDTTGLTIPQGRSGVAGLTLTPEGGFRGRVDLSLEGAPAGVVLSPTSLEVGRSRLTQTLTVEVGAGVAPGVYALRVRGTAGTLSRELDLRLRVTSPEDPPLPGAGEVWHRPGLDLHGVAYGGGRWVAVGEGGTLLTPADGLQWERVDAGTVDPLHSVAYGDGRWVAVGAWGTLLASTDGLRWQAVRSGTTEWLFDVAYGGGRWVAVGDRGTLLTSRDSLGWEGVRPGRQVALKGVAYGGGRWVVATGWDQILSSTDGLRWETVHSQTFVRFEDVAWGAGRWVAIGEGGDLFASTDGQRWQAIRLPDSHRGTLLGVAHGGDRWVAVGKGGTLLTSRDGLGWQPVRSPISLRFSAIAYGDGR